MAFHRAWISARLDADEAEASRPPKKDEGVPAEVAVRYLTDLAETWRRAGPGPGRRMLAEALFEQTDALGFREATLRLTDSAVAHGFASVIPSALQLAIVGNGRGERSSAHTYQLAIHINSGDSQPRLLANSA